MRRTIRNISLTALALLAIAGGALTARRTAEAQVAIGGFASTPVFDARGTAFAVFGGGNIGQLEAAAQGAGATGVWAQDPRGAYQLLVVKGPSFLTAPFTAAFPQGFMAATAVTLVRPAGATTPALSFDQLVSQGAYERTNVVRTTNALGLLSRNGLLDTSTAAYARVVFQIDPYLANPANAHTMDGQPWDRATRVGYEWGAFAENVFIAASTNPPTASAAAQTTVDGWMNSPTHRANILTGSFVDTGVGLCLRPAGRAAHGPGVRRGVCRRLRHAEVTHSPCTTPNEPRIAGLVHVAIASVEAPAEGV